ncbi:MAG: histidine kinase dimerization/phospho-acceptor domain-containing protein [Campylobacterota bacterium]|nr:histidine kinase dimerization/phospho-acceptor domain-containing protein [Campylobacterota bacterium]
MKNKEFQTVDEIAEYITHQINSPLTYIKGNLELMTCDIDELPSSSLKNELIQSQKKILDGIKRVESIVNVVHSVTKNK